MDKQKIINNAPPGATHLENGTLYWRYDSFHGKAYWWRSKRSEWIECNDTDSPEWYSMYPLEELKNLLKLEKAEEDVRSKYKNYVNLMDLVISALGVQSCIDDKDDLAKAISIFALEQQELGVHNLLTSPGCKYAAITTNYVRSYKSNIRDQIEKLKAEDNE